MTLLYLPLHSGLHSVSTFIQCSIDTLNHYSCILNVNVNSFRTIYRENCSDKMEQFLQRCFYQSGQYNSEEGFSELDRKLKEKEVILMFLDLRFEL